MTNKYFDTSSLLILGDSLFEETHDYNIYITSITLNELEHIKTSVNKDQNVKYIARQLLHKLDENQEKWNFISYTPSLEEKLKEAQMEINNDSRILIASYN